MLEWFRKKTGLLSHTEIESGGFVCSGPDVEHPDIQFHFIPGVFIDHGRKIPLYHAYEVRTNSQDTVSVRDISDKVMIS